MRSADPETANAVLYIIRYFCLFRLSDTLLIVLSTPEDGTGHRTPAGAPARPRGQGQGSQRRSGGREFAHCRVSSGSGLRSCPMSSFDLVLHLSWFVLIFVDTLLTDTRVDSFHDAHDMKHINHKQPGYARRVCTGRTRRTAELGNSIDTRRRADDRIDTCIRSAIGWRLVKSHPRSTRCGIQVGAMTVGELGRAPPT